MSEARVEQQRPASGAALLVLVGLGIAFALLVALLAVAKTHSGLSMAKPTCCIRRWFCMPVRQRCTWDMG